MHLVTHGTKVINFEAIDFIEPAHDTPEHCIVTFRSGETRVFELSPIKFRDYLYQAIGRRD
jgi:hypothetical protein